ncbi:hypothetical protein AB0M20_05500 [Actinoplanes sp. NPDC051633]|uniref:hypothetical protein n=1 Tax=Actinoplanes sp. NPDC051633 TaxID=3155670 RepID=UPI00341383EE
MDKDDRFGTETLAPLRDQQVPPLDVSIERAMAIGRRRVGIRRAAAGAAVAAGVLAMGGAVFAVGHRPPSASVPQPDVPPAQAPVQCRVSRLPAPKGADHATATAVAPSGRFVGGATLGSEETGENGAALLWDAGQLRTIEIEGRSATPLGVNDDGVVVGGVTRNHKLAAWVFRDGHAEILPGLPGHDNMFATGVNARGDIVGVAGGPGDVNKAVLWPAGEPGEIRTLPAPGSAGAMGISADGVVVGYANDRPYVWSAAGAARELPGGAEGTALGIAGDWVYGTSGPSADDGNFGSALKDAPHSGGRPARWSLSRNRLETLPGTHPAAITASGAMVGLTAKPERNAVVFRDRPPANLPPLSDRPVPSVVNAASVDGRTVAGEQPGERDTIPLLWRCS